VNARVHGVAGWTVAAALLLAGCGGGGDGGGDNPPPTLNIENTAMPDGVVGSPYVGQAVSNGGTGLHTYTLSGSLPGGLSFDGAEGSISGTPTGPAGETDISVTVTDSGSPAQTDTQAYMLRIAEPLIAAFGTPPIASIGAPYSHSMTASGGTPPYTFSADLPSGLSIDADGVISGVPTSDARTATGGAAISDSAEPPQVADDEFRVRVALAVSTTALPEAGGGESYAAQLLAEGGLPNFRWEMTGGDAPVNVSLGGIVTGPFVATCTVSDYTLDVTVTDDDTPAQSASRAGITLSVSPRAVIFPETSAPPVAAIGQLYNYAIGVTPGVAPYTFTVISGAPPPGISLNAASGVLSGTPSTAGTFAFTVRVTDDCGETDTRAFSLIVRMAPIGRNDSIATATPIGNGTIVASISPSGHPNTQFAPDEDYYEVQTTGTSTITVDLTGIEGGIDTVVELVNAAGDRLQSCVAPAYVDECMNDDRESGILNSLLHVRVNGATTFYVHVVEWRGDGRPDLRYRLELSGIN
jgi:Putative Ig domain